MIGYEAMKSLVGLHHLLNLDIMEILLVPTPREGWEGGAGFWSEDTANKYGCNN